MYFCMKYNTTQLQASWTGFLHDNIFYTLQFNFKSRSKFCKSLNMSCLSGIMSYYKFNIRKDTNAIHNIKLFCLVSKTEELKK